MRSSALNDWREAKNSLISGEGLILLLWYRLSQGMDSGEIIPMPSDYKISSQAEELFNKIKGMEFQQQITLFRDYVGPMGAEAKAGSDI